jgi:dihydroflavonol-4-reductase
MNSTVTHETTIISGDQPISFTGAAKSKVVKPDQSHRGEASFQPMKTAFVTGATGLLGNNLVRMLAARGVRVRALTRSLEKAQSQFGDMENVEVVLGDLTEIGGFAGALGGSDVLFHTAAFFRDSYKGGNHKEALTAVNEEGTARLMEAAYAAGIRRMVHTSSVAVLMGSNGQAANETMLRPEHEADDYYLSKIRTDQTVLRFLDRHPDMFVAFVLPGWMHGPGDLGPTSAGQFTLDYMKRKLPGIPPGGFSLVDARDVAVATIAAAEKGVRGERYIAAGQTVTMSDLVSAYERVTGIPAPRWKIPAALMLLLALANEGYARLTGRPVLISLAGIRLMLREKDRSHFDSSRTERELGVAFRPVEETLADEIAWYRRNGWLPAKENQS